MKVERALQADHSDYMRLVATFADEESAEKVHAELVRHLEAIFARAERFTCAGFGRWFETEAEFEEWKRTEWDPVADEHASLEVERKPDGTVRVLGDYGLILDDWGRESPWTVPASRSGPTRPATASSTWSSGSRREEVRWMSRSRDTSTSLCLLRRHGKRFRARLTRRGLVAYEPRTAIAIRLGRAETEALLQRPIPFDRLDDFCEVIHLEVSARCQLACPYCYLHGQDRAELPTAEWCRILSDLAGYGVFQVTFGAGEPTLRKDLALLAFHARAVGLNLCMTTNGIDLPRWKSQVLCLFNQVNVCYHHAAAPETLRCALAYLKECGVPCGINSLLTREYVSDTDAVAALAQEFDAELLLLSAKGVSAACDPTAVLAVAKHLHGCGLRVAVDGLSCRGVLNDFCLQKVRFCTVDSTGNVMPCSFVRTSVGNLREQSFADIWRSRGPQVPCPF